MALLPNVESAWIDDRKLIDYLLNADHPTGRHKAVFFERFGFSRDDWPGLRDALLQHAQTHDALALHTDEFGTRYNVTGPLACPDGRMPVVRAGWIIPKGETAPRFVSAFPG